MLHAVIMAGGSGTRLWPESRAGWPKQLLTLQGERSMIQATVDRLGTLVPLDRILIATTLDLAPKIHEQLSQLPHRAMLCEPCPRNTAPCIGLAAVRALREDPQAILAVMPADHVIQPQEVFQEAIRDAVAMVEEDPRRLVTFGIRTALPSTAFGYIERGEPLTPCLDSTAPSAVYHVAKFHEKPDVERARQYVSAGRFYWNAGIFVWKASAILDALGRYEPEMRGQLDRIARAADSPEFGEVLQREFAAMKRISIDYAVLERSPDVVVVEAQFAWDDVGSWQALERLHPADENGNLIRASQHVEIASTGNIVRAADPRHVVVLAGVSDLVVVVTPDATLVANKRDEKSIAAVNAELKRRGHTEWL